MMRSWIVRRRWLTTSSCLGLVVFSYKNDFSLIEFIYKMKGEHIFMKPNLKAEVVSGLGRY